MLIFWRKRREGIVIAGDIRVRVVEIRGDHVRLGIEAPKEIPVHRGEVDRRIRAGGVEVPRLRPPAPSPESPP